MRMDPRKKYGFWMVTGGKIFFNKAEALVYASQHNLLVKFVYHSQVWNEFDRSRLGKVSLQALYKERALQLRDKYDYLVLYYSGGADSDNVLQTFLKNKIKLDEICVKWPKPLMDGKFYSSNKTDNSARNYWSEWDYAIKPYLKKLSKKHPDIKITIKDYMNQISKLDFENLFVKFNSLRAGMIVNTVISDSALKDKKRVGHIYGIDKPLITLDPTSNDVFMYFTDDCLDLIGLNEIDPGSAEPFYWTPDMPNLAYEMAYQVSQYYLFNKEQRKFIHHRPYLTDEEWKMFRSVKNDIAKKILYKHWDNRFQVSKPESASRKDKFFWIYENSELSSVKEILTGVSKEKTDQIANRWLEIEKDPINKNNITTYKVLRTDLYYVTHFQDD